MTNSKWKKAGGILAGVVLLLGFLIFLLYLNRQKFLPNIEKVAYLQAELTKGRASVNAGIEVNNPLPFSFKIDSVFYQIRSQDVLLGWGNKRVTQTLPPAQTKVFSFPLLLNTARYKKHVTSLKGQDSLELDVEMKIYFDPPFLGPQSFTKNRKIKTALPKSSSISIDSFYVQRFTPDSGYTFVLNLNTGENALPDLEIASLHYSIRLSDSILIGGKIDSSFKVSKSGEIIPVPIQVKTTDLLGLFLKKPKTNTKRRYHAEASATLKSSNALFSNTAVQVKKTGSLDISKLATGKLKMPYVKQVKTLELIAKEKKTFLQAELLVYNPGKLPLYVDHARYLVRHEGKIIAKGGNDLKKVLPSTGNQVLHLDLTVNNQEFSKLSAQSQVKNEVPLEVELLLDYNLKNSKPQQIAIRKNINFPVTKKPSFELKELKINELDPERGAHLMVRLLVKNETGNNMQLDNLNYRLVLQNYIDVTGALNQPLALSAGNTEVEIPVNLSGKDVSLVAKGLVQGIETWNYTFSGNAKVSVPNSLIQQTDVTIQTAGVYNINSKGTPDFMPEISKIDTLHVTINYDTAWVNMYAAIYNTLPATIHVSQLQVAVVHQNETVGKTEEKLNMNLTPNANTFTWHTLGVNYGLWEKHVLNQQGKDSMVLNFPTTLTFYLGNLDLERIGIQQALLDLKTKIPTPATPVTELQRLKLRGFGFKSGLKFNALISVQNTNSAGLVIKDIDYLIILENGVDMRGKLNTVYTIPIGQSEVTAPVNLSIWESAKLLFRQLFGPSLIDYKIKATAKMHTSNPKLNDVFVVFENNNQSDMRKKKTPRKKS